MAGTSEGTDDLRQRHASLLAKAQACLLEAAEAATALEAFDAVEAKTKETQLAPHQYKNASSAGMEKHVAESGESLQPCEGPQQHGLWTERVDVWQSSVDRFHQGARTSADIAAYADRLSDTAGLTLDATRERSLEALVETQERYLVTLQAAEALERAALHRDEVMLARLAEELSMLEASLRGECPASVVSNTKDYAPRLDAREQLLQRLVDNENKLIHQTKQESEQLRAAMLEIGERIARCERDASLLADARQAAKALLTAGPEDLRAQVASLEQAALSMQNDIDILRAGGYELSNRSMEVAEEMSFAEAEVEAESSVRAFAKQRIDVASRATNEQHAIYRLLSTPVQSAII